MLLDEIYFIISSYFVIFCHISMGFQLFGIWGLVLQYDRKPDMCESLGSLGQPNPEEAQANLGN
jgi:hypothetical protein